MTLDEVHLEFDEVAAVDRDYDVAQDAAADLRSQADELIQEVMEQLRFNLRALDRPSRRRVMRTYGAKFHTVKEMPKDGN